MHLAAVPQPQHYLRTPITNTKNVNKIDKILPMIYQPYLWLRAYGPRK